MCGLTHIQSNPGTPGQSSGPDSSCRSPVDRLGPISGTGFQLSATFSKNTQSKDIHLVTSMALGKTEELTPRLESWSNKHTYLSVVNFFHIDKIYSVTNSLAILLCYNNYVSISLTYPAVLHI